MFGGIACETVLFIVLLYVPGINGVFGGRRLDFFLLGIPGLMFSMTLLIWEETRKFLMNLNSNNGNPNWWSKNLCWWFNHHWFFYLSYLSHFIDINVKCLVFRLHIIFEIYNYRQIIINCNFKPSYTANARTKHKSVWYKIQDSFFRQHGCR